MTKDEALKMCLEYIETNAHERRHVRWAIKEALAEPEQEPQVCCGEYDTCLRACTPRGRYLAQPEQEPVARVIDNGTPEGATEWIPFTNRVEPLKTGDLLYTTPPQPEQEPLDFAYVMEAGDDKWKKLPIQER